MIRQDMLRCRVCEYPTSLTAGGRFIDHTVRGNRCAGSGTAPEVYFRKITVAVPGSRHEAGSTAHYAAYTRVGAYFVGQWSNGGGTAWWQPLPMISYRQWRKAMVEGVEPAEQVAATAEGR